jgi:hypothetical protein
MPMMKLTFGPSRLAKVLAAAIGAVMAGGVSFAASNWAVGLASGATSESQSASIQNLTISAVASPAATNLLYPGGRGDAILQISNPNPYPVTVTAVSIPPQTSMASGYQGSNLQTTQPGCGSNASDVYWYGAAASTNTTETLSTPVTVAAASGGTSATLSVVLTNDAFMTSAAPSACASTYFQMPSFAGITATGGAATASSSPASSGW